MAVPSTDAAPSSPLEPELRARLLAVCEDGWEFFDRFDREERQRAWHPFVHADYEVVLDALAARRAPGRRFLEWGSATGVVTIMADLMGFEARGIELDPALVDHANGLAQRHGSGARFAAGSFLPAGYRWRPRHGDGRLGTLGDGPSAYRTLGNALDDFDLVYAYPWEGEEPLMRDLMRRYGAPHATLLLYRGSREVVAVGGAFAGEGEGR
jgi:hypothetical protein